MTRLVLIIDDQLCAVQRVWRERSNYPAWSMLREGSETRTVTIGQWTTMCDCPDYVMRKQPAGLLCRHIEALLEVGIIEPRTP